jgi:hypothetical protein
MSDLLVEMNNVVSGNIATIGYNKVYKVLRVRFKNGGHYQYDEVPEHVYDEMRKASSVGKYFSVIIRNRFKCTKLPS